MPVQKRKKQQGGKKNRKLGRCLRKPSKKNYKLYHRRYHNKLKRVRQSCGEAYALEWDKQYHPYKKE